MDANTLYGEMKGKIPGIRNKCAPDGQSFFLQYLNIPGFSNANDNRGGMTNEFMGENKD